MQTGVKPKAASDGRDFVMIPSDQVRVAPSDAEITDLLRAAARQHSEAGGQGTPDPSAPVPTVDTTFRATAGNDEVQASGPTFRRRLMRIVAALLLAAGISGAALGWQTFGYVAKKALISWAPKWAIATSLPLDKLGWSSTEAKPSDEPADAAPAQADASTPAAADASTPVNAVANAAAPSSDAAQQQLQSMARDLASANQEIEALKASIAELKASQQQVTRDLAKAASDRTAEQATARAKAAAARKLATPSYSPSPTTSAAAPAYRPTPSTYSSAQAAMPQPPQSATAQPYVPPPPVQLQPQADPGMPATAPRPPMPVQ
jgi:hypothetical protein